MRQTITVFETRKMLRVFFRLSAHCLAVLTGNAPAQRFLRFVARVAAYLMGIGAGTNVENSGELDAIDLVKMGLPGESLIVFDVGANVGSYLQGVIDHLGVTSVCVHCFEPAISAFAALVANAPANANAIFNNCALGDSVGERILYADKPGSGLASLTRRNLDYLGIDFSHKEQVYVSTIDSYCAEKHVDRINVLKLDAEGHELEILSGASRMLSKGGIDLITFEFGGCNIGTRTFLVDFWRLLRGHDMELYRITPNGYMAPIAAYQEMDEQFVTTNFLAIGTNLRAQLSW